MASPHRKFNASLMSLERRPPRLLKDFLNEDCPRTPCKLPVPPKTAASTTISALHKVINIVKFFPHFAAASVKSPSILPRSISRKLSKRSAPTPADAGKSAAMVKVKDILRWRSSRDLVEEKSTPLEYDDFPESTTITTTTNSKRSSWCDSDFTAEDLPSWCGEIDEQHSVNGGGMGKKKNVFLTHEGVGGYFMETKTKMGKQMDPKVELCFDENDQHSPVSVLESSPFTAEEEEDDEAFTFHRKSCRNKCMTKLQQQQQEEQEEEIRGTKQTKIQIHLTTDNIITSCFNDDDDEESYEWEVEEKREAYIRDMEKAAGMRWYKFDEEKEEICQEMELEVFRDLVNEVLVEFFNA